MSLIFNLFPHKQADISTETPPEMFTRLAEQERLSCTRSVVILINDRAGSWEVRLETCAMSNAETNLALDIVKDLVLTTVIS